HAGNTGDRDWWVVELDEGAGARADPLARMSGADTFAALSAAELALLPPAALPRTVEPMKAVSTTDRFSDEGWIFERKLDGIRCIATSDGSRVRLASRNDLSLNE